MQNPLQTLQKHQKPQKPLLLRQPPRRFLRSWPACKNLQWFSETERARGIPNDTRSNNANNGPYGGVGGRNKRKCVCACVRARYARPHIRTSSCASRRKNIDLLSGVLLCCVCAVASCLLLRRAPFGHDVHFIWALTEAFSIGQGQPTISFMRAVLMRSHHQGRVCARRRQCICNNRQLRYSLAGSDTRPSPERPGSLDFGGLVHSTWGLCGITSSLCPCMQGQMCDVTDGLCYIQIQENKFSCIRTNTATKSSTQSKRQTYRPHTALSRFPLGSPCEVLE